MTENWKEREMMKCKAVLDTKGREVQRIGIIAYYKSLEEKDGEH